MGTTTARSLEIPRPLGPPRPPEVPPQPVPFPQPHVPVVPSPPRVAHVSIPQVPALPPTWEYKQVTRAGEMPALDEAELNALGRDGWELVAAVTDAQATHFYFKRERI